MKGCVTVAMALVLGGLPFVKSAGADPGHAASEVAVFGCVDGRQVQIDVGRLTSGNHQPFLIGLSGTPSGSIYVVDRLARTADSRTTVLFDMPSPLRRLLPVTCTADRGGGVTLAARGFFGPPGVGPVAGSTSADHVCGSASGTFGNGQGLSDGSAVWACTDRFTPYPRLIGRDTPSDLGFHAVAPLRGEPGRGRNRVAVTAYDHRHQHRRSWSRFPAPCARHRGQR